MGPCCSQRLKDAKLENSPLKRTTANKIKGHNESGDDVKAMTPEQIQKLGRYAQFEKQFPFYRMNINGFFHHIEKAQLKDMFGEEQGEEEPEKHDVAYVKMEQLQAEFKPFESWSALQDQESHLYKFLAATCKYEGELKEGEEGGVVLHELKLKTLGLMWCSGSKQERATQFYGMVQDFDQDEIACSDKDFNEVFDYICYLMTDAVFEHEPATMGTEPNEEVNEDSKEEAKEFANDLKEEILDIIYGMESRVKREEWIKGISGKASFVMDSKEIRKRLYANAVK